ncbi:hypothetical protein BU24DRAFT_265325 [Aaosphaeria arxii CBS 175.79]|uniref:Zn(2)-C6 fungal-type domain-containing protein n=1 Tax=Aaosphaeria arxii CBS 175.79 TaxID=1450172 RepID=A0A6A5XF47_9PLEO|nr:uncharacterized protein BU24DRAFT_265325 [Aaosphaeria arxii CBS 175.79]KAF2011865.1 hypothetical protein BU24DRAFT_265325 [Aaosphaeria arxii CBS 175.79]
MSSRKPHSKSRFGCLPCKKRHIKCGEEQPSCHNCSKRRVCCTYGLSQATATGHASRANSEERAHTQDSLLQIPLTCHCMQDPLIQTPAKVTRLQELQLIIHYTTTTCNSMAHNLDDIEIWRRIVPEEAVRHEFLMDGLLALSSLHLADESPDLRWHYTEIATHYHSSGLRKYRDALEMISSDNSIAIFAFSIIITILALAFPRSCSVPTHTSLAESMVSMFELLRGTRLISQGTGSSFREGKLAALFQPNSQDPGLPTPSGDTDHALIRLRERANSFITFENPERHEAYLSGIETLKTAFGQMEMSRYYLGPVIAWPTMVSEKLFALFKDDDPMAKLIIIHYGVLLLYARDRWWGRDIGTSLIETLANSLCDADPAWASWTEWAREAATLATHEPDPPLMPSDL